MNRLQLSNQLQNQCNNIEIAFAGADMILIVHFHLQQHRGLVQWLALRTRDFYASSSKPTQPIQSSSNEGRRPTTVAKNLTNFYYIPRHKSVYANRNQ